MIFTINDLNHLNVSLRGGTNFFFFFLKQPERARDSRSELIRELLGCLRQPNPRPNGTCHDTWHADILVGPSANNPLICFEVPISTCLKWKISLFALHFRQMFHVTSPWSRLCFVREKTGVSECALVSKNYHFC